MKRIAGHIGLFVVYGAAGALILLLVGVVVFLESREDLEIWHKAELDREYRIERDVASFTDYLALEAALFEDLEAEVVEPVSGESNSSINRYVRNSLSSPDRWQRDWNRSYELRAEDPSAAVLMLHGMSDSPYSLRAMGERLHAEGVHVLGLRYPGHGTAPASLTRTRWEDMYGAVALAARHLAKTLPDTPLYVFGYSTGGPLAVELSLRALGDDSVPLPDGLVLFSPAMGITPLAALTPWQARLGRLLGFEKMAWNSIELEYDPYKYRSFPLNAALQVWRLANHVDAGLASAAASGGLGGFPPTLSFQSVVDNTIEVPAIVHSLYDRLPESSAESEHALVIYDFNRSTEVELLLTSDPRAALNALLQNDARRYAFTVVSNTSEDSRAVLATTGPRSGRERMVCVLDSLWPQGTYSLSHIAPTFPPDDPLYGGAEAKPYDGISLGNVVLRGEAGALRVSAAGFLRQTFNPFFDYQLLRIRGFMNLAGPPPCSLPGG